MEPKDPMEPMAPGEPGDIPDALPEDFPDEPLVVQPTYRNLLVPLIVVPAMIVMVLVLIWVLFGAIVGEEASPKENLSRMIHGTSNERDQASMLLVQQIVDHLEAVKEDRDAEWEIDESFLPEVQLAWEDTDADDLRFRYVLGTIQARLDDDNGIPHLVSVLGSEPGDDPDGQIRFLTLLSLGAMGELLDPPEQEVASKAVARFLQDEDTGLRQAAAIALQTLPGEATLPALRSALSDGLLAVRGNAAISLSHLGDPEAARVLMELLDLQAYADERGRRKDLWANAEDVSRSRIMAVEALARLGRPQDLAALEPVSLDDPDMNVRGAALAALARFKS